MAAGWFLMFYGIATIGSPARVSPEKVRAYEAFEAARQEEKLTAFRAKGRDLGIEAYLSYTIQGHPDIVKESREIIAGRPDRDEQLSRLLKAPEHEEDAVRYLVNVHENPSAKLAPGMRHVLEKELTTWRAKLAGVDQAWAASISFQGFVIAGCRVHKGGGKLKPQLVAWRDFLVEMVGCDYLVKYIDESLAEKP